MNTEFKTVHPVTKHELLCDKIFLSDAYPDKCEICKTIKEARDEGFRMGWEVARQSWKMNNETR